MRAKLLWPFLFVFIGYVAVIFFGRLGDRMILWPQAGHVDAGGAERRAIPFESGTLETWVAGPKNPDIWVLRFYGNADRADRWVASEAASFAPKSVAFMGVNYPGYGGSDGTATLAHVADSAVAAYDALAKDGKPIYVFGTSLGTTAALHLAAERPVAGLVLQNPPPLRELIWGRHGWWNLWLLAGPVGLQIPRALDSIDNATRATCPAIFLLADHDEVVPHEYHLRVAKTYAGRKTVLIQKDAGHNTPLSPADAAAFHHAVEEMWK